MYRAIVGFHRECSAEINEKTGNQLPIVKHRSQEHDHAQETVSWYSTGQSFPCDDQANPTGYIPGVPCLITKTFQSSLTSIPDAI